jgi:isopentenyl diphosphate isomerase/L-lactate dehydrogenase-like FMN-dependent dehydrogenase
VAEVLAILRAELDRTLALAGCPRVADVGPELVGERPALPARS